MEREEKAATTFRSNPRSILSDKPMAFNGVRITLDGEREIKINQEDQNLALTLPKGDKEFTSRRPMSPYIGVDCRPDVCAPVQLIAPGRDLPTTTKFKTFYKVIKNLNNTADMGLIFVPLGLKTSRLVFFTDASFENDRDFKSQFGFVLCMADSPDNSNVIHFISSRCRRVTRSVL